MASSSTHFQFMFMSVLIILATWASQAVKHQRWMTRYGKVCKNQDVKEKRFNIFTANVEYIESSNAGNKPYKLSVNEFADQTIEEFKSSRNGYKKFTGINIIHVRKCYYSTIHHGLEKERSCNTRCCWAFSAVAAMEGITQLTTGKLTSLSEQELVDCDTKGEDQGCEGGCNAKKADTHTASINGYEDVPANNKASLLKAVSKQPVSVAIDASGQDFQFYSSGVFAGTCGTELDHGVTAVGYGTDSDGTKYWLVKTSWGTSWGENGYIRMQRDVDANQGLCGIAMEASYPTA
ncbi:hypothetical protein MKX03_018995 [Papaver bracteatum]|nr:hypothetical protein MKX03_018995 [Papaver bracteatum]